jgi:hypothetical protein
MARMKKLELNLETVRDLSESDLAGVAGGVQTSKCTDLLTTTQTPMCPSGSTWFTSCESYNGQTCS